MFNQSRAESRSAPGPQCLAAELVRRTRIYLDAGSDELIQEAGEEQGMSSREDVQSKQGRIS